MAIVIKKIDVAERKTKGGGTRPAFTYEGIDRTSIRTDSPENFYTDILEITSGDLEKLANFVVEGFNTTAEKESNPTKDETVKSVLAAMKSVGKTANLAKAIEIAQRLKAEVNAIPADNGKTVVESKRKE